MKNTFFENKYIAPQARLLRGTLKNGIGIFFILSLLISSQGYGNTVAAYKANCDLLRDNRTAAANRDHLIEQDRATRDKNLGLARIQGERDIAEDSAESTYLISLATILATYEAEEAACYLLAGPGVGPCIITAKAVSIALTAAAYNIYRLAMDAAAFNYNTEKASIMNEWQDRLEDSDNLLTDALFLITTTHASCISGAATHTH